jgi:hypothetical protein
LVIKGATVIVFKHPFRHHGGFQQTFGTPIGVNRFNAVFVSICELDSNGVPFQGSASLMVHNVVPHDGNQLTVRGEIGWNSDVNVQLSIMVP